MNLVETFGLRKTSEGDNLTSTKILAIAEPDGDNTLFSGYVTNTGAFCSFLIELSEDEEAVILGLDSKWLEKTHNRVVEFTFHASPNIVVMNTKIYDTNDIYSAKDQSQVISEDSFPQKLIFTP